MRNFCCLRYIDIATRYGIRMIQLIATYMIHGAVSSYRVLLYNLWTDAYMHHTQLKHTRAVKLNRLSSSAVRHRQYIVYRDIKIYIMI